MIIYDGIKSNFLRSVEQDTIAFLHKKLKGGLRKNSIDNMFKSSGIYVDAGENIVDTILVDDYAIIGLSQKTA